MDWQNIHDNSKVLEWLSNALCKAVTGTSDSKRELYSDDDVIYQYKKPIGFNGINLAATRSDLLDRGLIFVVHRLEEVFTETRDYRPVFDKPNPENYFPDDIIQLSDYLREFTEYAYSDKWNSIQRDELSKVKGLLQIEEKKESIDNDLQDTVDAHDGVKTIIAKIKELMNSGVLPQISDDYHAEIKQSKAETQKKMQQETLQ